MLDNIEKEKYVEFFNSSKQVSGLTHNFYRYPARFSPQFVRHAILKLSEEGDLVLDAFMGGGTTIVEAIANGRNAIGIDINPIAHFITKVKTTPLSYTDKDKVLNWVDTLNFYKAYPNPSDINNECLKNLPEEMKVILSYAMKSLDQLEYRRQRNFARCALLKFGQWAIDCRENLPDRNILKDHFLAQVSKMLAGLEELVNLAKENGVRKNQITCRRKLYVGSINELILNPIFTRLRSKVKLVLTSPPYPGVHVLYHRWQVNSRRETPAPCWLAGTRNGHGESYYTLGGRSIAGTTNYFRRLREIFDAIRLLIHPDAIIVQLISFTNPEVHLPAFLAVMNSAGFEEISLFQSSELERLVRKVPNRKWYTHSASNQHASSEVLLAHHLR